MKLVKRAALMLTLVFSMVMLVSCGPKPDATVKNFFDAAKKTDFSSMANCMKKSGNKGDLKFDDKDQETIVKSVFSKVSYEVVSSTVDGDKATVKTKVTSVDLPKIYSKTVSDLMPSLMASELAGKNEDAKTQIMQTFINSINSPKVDKTTTEVDIKLVKDSSKGWLIEPNDDLMNAMSGNMEKAFSQEK